MNCSTFSGNRIRRELVWQSRWRVRADELADFENLTGAPAAWAGADTVVTEVTPRRISELEYELAIEAQALTNTNLYRNYSEDDRSNLQGRSDVNARLIDFLSGVAYAGEGKIKKVAANTYIITPYSVDIMGDLIDELENNGLYF